MRIELCLSYGGWGVNAPLLGENEYFLGVYRSTPGNVIVTPCKHRHFGLETAIWCKKFPTDRPPSHVVVMSKKTSRVVRRLAKIGT